jgi:hypothetical protein
VLEVEWRQVLQGSVSTGAKEDESGTGCIWATGFHYGKGKVPHWGTSAPQPKAYCALTLKEFLHSSLEALHTERYATPQLAKEGTM